MDKPTVYDVFKGTPQKKSLWLGTVNGLGRAIDQMNRMFARLPGDYFVSDSATHEVLASVQISDLGATPVPQLPTIDKLAN
jgi:hypothetical protein